jgi:hypothetical protein
MADSNPLEPPPGIPEDQVDALYGLPLDEFTPRRDLLAKELRAARERDAAAWVKGLRKPTAAAWLVNQLARTQRAEARRVLDSAEELRSAQERILGGQGGAHELTALAEQHADALHGLMSKAPGLLDRDGRTPSGATLERAGETVRAIPLDDEARLGFAAGRLTREHRAAGLGFFGSGEGSGRSERRAKAKPSSDEKAQARAALAEAKARLRAQANEVAEHKRQLSRAEREVEAAQRRRDDAAVALERARAREAAARELVDEADAAAKRLR